MISETDSSAAAGGQALQRYVPLIVYAIVVLVILVIPLKILTYGYLPIYDDALPDAAKAVSGKPWPEILVLKSSYTMDHHVGWHTLLQKLHQAMKWDAEGLVLFSVAGLFMLAAWSALPWLKRPEAWIAVLIIVMGVGSY